MPNVLQQPLVLVCILELICSHKKVIWTSAAWCQPFKMLTMYRFLMPLTSIVFSHFFCHFSFCVDLHRVQVTLQKSRVHCLHQDDDSNGGCTYMNAIPCHAHKLLRKEETKTDWHDNDVLTCFDRFVFKLVRIPNEFPMSTTHCSWAAFSEQHPANIRCTGTPIMMQASVPQLVRQERGMHTKWDCESAKTKLLRKSSQATSQVSLGSIQ